MDSAVLEINQLWLTSPLCEIKISLTHFRPYVPWNSTRTNDLDSNCRTQTLLSGAATNQCRLSYFSHIPSAQDNVFPSLVRPPFMNDNEIVLVILGFVLGLDSFSPKLDTCYELNWNRFWDLNFKLLNTIQRACLPLPLGQIWGCLPSCAHCYSKIVSVLNKLIIVIW